MATTTPRIGLTKPDGTDLVDIAVLNTNFDKIDSNIASTKIQATKPATANAGDLWWDSDTGTLYVYYTDANSSQWVAATSDPINIGVVASQAERDAQYPTPAQGMSVYRTDLGVTQRYYGLFNSSTNPGGRDTAGWYNTEKNVGLVPISPASVTAVTGTATVNSLGAITVTGCTKVILNGVFTSAYKQYRIIYSSLLGSSSTTLLARYVTSGTESSVSYYEALGNIYATAGFTNGSSQNIAQIQIGFIHTAGVWGSGVTDLNNVFSVAPTTHTTLHSGYDSSSQTRSCFGGGFHNAAVSYDGISILPNTGNFSGTIQVYGYNN